MKASWKYIVVSPLSRSRACGTGREAALRGQTATPQHTAGPVRAPAEVHGYRSQLVLQTCLQGLRIAKVVAAAAVGVGVGVGVAVATVAVLAEAEAEAGAVGSGVGFANVVVDVEVGVAVVVAATACAAAV